MINQKPKNTPMRNPTSTWVSVCCLSIMRLLPTTPATRKMTHSHHIGLKTKSSENASSAPAKPPMAAVWVDIFHQMLIMAHTIWMTNAATRILAINCGMRCTDMT